MAKRLKLPTLDLEVWGSSLACHIVSLARKFTPLCLSSTLRWTSIPSISNATFPRHASITLEKPGLKLFPFLGFWFVCAFT